MDTEFRYNKDVDLSKYDYYVVDKDFKKKARAGEFDEILKFRDMETIKDVIESIIKELR